MKALRNLQSRALTILCQRIRFIFYFDPPFRYLYWTDWGNEAAIERISMDGNKTTREAIIKQDIRWPNGLTLDFEYNRLYWADAKLWRLEAANLDGTGRRILVRNIIGFPFSLTNVGKWLYWSDWLDSTIKATTKFRSTKNMKTVGIPSPRIMGVKAVDASGQPSGTVSIVLQTVIIKDRFNWFVRDLPVFVVVYTKHVYKRYEFYMTT